VCLALECPPAATYIHFCSPSDPGVQLSGDRLTSVTEPRQERVSHASSTPVTPRRWSLPGDEEDPGALDRLSWWVALGPPLVIALVEYLAQLSGITGSDATVGRVVAMFAGIAVGWYLWRRSAREFRAAHLRVVARKTEMAALKAAVEERERLGRELHDGAAQVLAYLLMKTDTVVDLLATGRVMEAERQLEHLRESADKAYQEARDAVVDLRTNPVRRGLASALRSLCEQISERTQLTISLHVTPIADRMTPTVQLQAFQITREALGNVQAHAQARSVWVRVDAHGPDAVALSVRDDGTGFDPEVAHVGKKRFGLLTMRERAESVGGTLGITGQRGKGTTVVAELPLQARMDGDHGDASAAS